MRALQGLLGGIGFIGGGAILKAHGGVYGLATAASLWNTGAIGASVAFAREEIAVVLSLTNLLLLRLLTPLVVTTQPAGKSAGIETKSKRNAKVDLIMREIDCKS